MLEKEKFEKGSQNLKNDEFVKKITYEFEKTFTNLGEVHEFDKKFVNMEEFMNL